MFDDADIIHAYSRAEALEDGDLVDLSALAPDVCRQHFKYPVACTAAVWNIIDRAIKNEKQCNDLKGVIHDVLTMSKHPTERIDPTQHLFKVIITGAARESTFTFQMVCGPGDSAEPVLTVMLPGEN